MNNDDKTPDLKPEQAFAYTRALFMRDLANISVDHAINRPKMKGQFVPAADAYYRRVAEAFIEHAHNCPTHAFEDIVGALKEMEDYACQAVVGTVHMTAIPGLKPGDAQRMRDANNTRMGLPPGS